MSYKTFEAEVEVDLSEWTTEELKGELEDRGVNENIINEIAYSDSEKLLLEHSKLLEVDQWRAIINKIIGTPIHQRKESFHKEYHNELANPNKS